MGTARLAVLARGPSGNVRAPTGTVARGLVFVFLVGTLLHLANGVRLVAGEGQVILLALAVGHPMGPFFIIAVLLALASAWWCWQRLTDPPHPWLACRSARLLAMLAVACALGLAVRIAKNEPTLASDLARFDAFATFFVAGVVNAVLFGVALAVVLARKTRASS